MFEGARVNALVRTIADWDTILDGLPRLGVEAFSWARPRDPSWGGAWGE